MTVALGIDFETTGLNHNSDLITEIGAVLWDTDRNSPLKLYSELITIPRQLTEEIIQLTGITDEMLETFGKPLVEGIGQLAEMAECADWLVAHNAEFEKSFIAAALEQVGSVDSLVDRDWIDTKTDLPYTRGEGRYSLRHICADHGFINPFPHRAVFDVMAMLTLMGKYPFPAVVEIAKSPTIKVIAKVSYEKRDDAKNAGFYWDGETKIWSRNYKKILFERENPKFPFLIQIVQ